MEDSYAHVYVFMVYLDGVYIIIFTVHASYYFSLKECD